MQKNNVALAVIFSLNIPAIQAESFMTGADEDLMLLYEDEEIIEIATGTSKPIHLAPSVASVITAKDIKLMGARTLDEALESLPGLHVSKSTNRNSSIYSIRGIHTTFNPHVLLLVNGLPFNDVVNASRPPLFRLPVDNIARIEVVRGPGSAVFGADAFAGVINIITKDGHDIDGGVVGGRVGSFKTREGWIQYGGDHSGWDIGVSIEYSNSGGDQNRIVESDFQSALDIGFGTSATLTPSPLETEYSMLNSSISLKRKQWSIWLNSWNLSDAGVGPGIAQAIDPVGEQENDQYTFIVDYKDDNIANVWRLDSRFSYRVVDLQSSYRILPPGTVVPIGIDGNLCFPPACTSSGIVNFTDGLLGNPGGEQVETRFELAGIYSGWQDHLIRLAVGFDRDEVETRETKNFGPGVIDGTVSPINGTLSDVTGTSNIFLKDRSRTVNYLSLQDEWRLGRDWELTAGVRYDDYSDFGDTTNPRLALVWATDYNLTSKLLYGRAFRAPGFGELFFENNPVIQGNANLKPEKVDMLELVFDYRPSFDLETVMSLFVYQADDLIDYVNGTAENAREQEGRGIELEANWQIKSDLRLKGNFAFQHSRETKMDVTVPFAPRRQLFLAADWRVMQAWSIYTQANFVSDRARTASDTRPSIDDYTTVDMALHYRPPTQPFNLTFSVKNVLDEDAYEPSNGAIPKDYPLEGRAAYLEAEYQFK